MRHVLTITFEDGRRATIIIDEDSTVSVHGLRNIRAVEYQGIERK